MRFLLFLICAAACMAADWSAPAEVRHDDKLVMTYRATWDGEFLIVRAAIEPGWHTFVMDNKQRQQEKLAGKPSLGIEKSTTVKTAGALQVTGPWRQAPPQDFSKPEIQWFTFGYEREALFAAKAQKAEAGAAQVEVTGQACAQEICKNIDVTLEVPVPAKPSKADVNLASLVLVK
jgi:thiol:disulfide interchange protein